MRTNTANRLARTWVPCLAALLAALILAGCGGSAPAVRSLYYSLHYPAPAPQSADKLEATLSVARFSTAPGFNATEMYYGDDQVELAAYNYHRWLVVPGEMIGDFLTRDLAATKHFTAVFSYRDGVSGRFRLQGSVCRFQELDRAAGAEALLEVSATLLDNRQSSVDSRVMFQRWYRATEPMAKKDARSLAEAMSRAAARVSAQIAGDVRRAVGMRLQERPSSQ